MSPLESDTGNTPSTTITVMPTLISAPPPSRVGSAMRVPSTNVPLVRAEVLDLEPVGMAADDRVAPRHLLVVDRDIGVLAADDDLFVDINRQTSVGPTHYTQPCHSGEQPTDGGGLLQADHSSAR